MLIPFVLSVSLGVSLWLVYEGLTNPRPPAAGRRWGWLEDFLLRAGLPDVRPREFALFSVAGGVAAGGLAELALGWPVVSLAAAALGALLPLVYYLRRHDRRRRAVEAALVEAISQARDGIRTGLSVPHALALLGRSGPDILRAEFATLAREAQVSGFEPAIEHMRARLASPLWDTCAIALEVNDSLGSRHVGRLLDRLAHATRAQLRVEDELRASQGRTVLSARIVAAVPLALLVVLRTSNPQYVALFNTPGGQLLLFGCVASIITGYAAMLWVGRLPSQPRVFQ